MIYFLQCAPDYSLLTHRRASRDGFTLVELLIYVGITAIVMGLFAGILVTMIKIQERQSAGSKATNELGFLMTTMHRLVSESVILSVPNSQTLDLTVTTSTSPQTKKRIFFDNVAKNILLGENSPTGASTSTLSSTNIRIDDLSFAYLSNGLSQSVAISLTATTFPNNPTQSLTRTIKSTAALYVQEQ